MRNAFQYIFVWVLSAAFGLSVVACSDDLAISQYDQPLLSADTLQLGYLIAGNSSKTYQLRVINPCSKEIRLTSVSLRNGGESGFRMNVDGMMGTSFNNPDLLHIGSHDSLFIFVEATLPEKGIGQSEHIDYIDITCNGILQTVVLQATSKEVEKLKGEVIRTNQVWNRTKEVQIYDSLVVAEGVTLSLKDSITVYLHDKANFIVRGTLLCEGKSGAMITIRGDRTDNMFSNLPYDNLPSQWGRLVFEKTSKGSTLEYTNIHGMTEGICVDAADVTFCNCVLKLSGDNLISGNMAKISMENCELSNAAGALFEVYGGWHNITHCTLANYNFAAQIRQCAVHLCNIDPDSVATPLHSCRFTNTIVWGDTYTPDVYPDYVKIETGKNALGQPVYADSIFCYTFDHCLLRANGTDDKDFISTLWNKDPLYQLIDDENYTYDFHVTEKSPAIGAGTKTEVKYDLEGVARLDKPTIGCYEFVKK